MNVKHNINVSNAHRKLQYDVKQEALALTFDRKKRGVELPDLDAQIKEALAEAKISQGSGITINGKELQYNKAYKMNGVHFKLWNPARLSKKQENVVHKFMYGVDGKLAGMVVKFTDYAPWIDLIFALNRGEITEAQWASITKIKLNISTFNYHHDHNL